MAQGYLAVNVYPNGRRYLLIRDSRTNAVREWIGREGTEDASPEKVLAACRKWKVRIARQPIPE